MICKCSVMATPKTNTLFKQSSIKTNPANGTHKISRRVLIVAPIPFYVALADMNVPGGVVLRLREVW